MVVLWFAELGAMAVTARTTDEMMYYYTFYMDVHNDTIMYNNRAMTIYTIICYYYGINIIV